MTEKRPPSPEPLPLPMTDAHTHLGWGSSRGLPAAEAVELATSANVTRMVDVGCDVPSSREAILRAERHPGVVAAVGLHPNDAAVAGAGLDEELCGIEALITASERVRAVGESGLDFFRTPEGEGRVAQRISFAAHIALARRYDRALVIHDRDAHDEVLAVLDAEGWPQRIQFHCFSGDAAFARRCLDGGAHLSFPGTITYKGNDALREALRLTPADRLLVETDAPFLTPMPFRGRTNSPYLVPVTVRAMAEIRGDDLAELCAVLHANATAVFGDWGGPGDDVADETAR